ncbi:MAG: RNB domain-containing ribonuclease [Bilophila wadsworthia]
MDGQGRIRPGNDWCEEHRDELDALLAQAAEDERRSRPSRTGPSSASTPRPPATWTMPFHRSPARRRLEPDAGAGLPGLPLAVRGKLDKAVFNRATSIYLPEATHHMLSEARLWEPTACWPKDAAFPAHRMHRGSRRPRGRVRTARRLCPACGEPVLRGLRNRAGRRESPASPIWSSSGRPSNSRGPIRSAASKKAPSSSSARTSINLEGAGENITVSLDEDPLAPKAHLLVSELMVLTNAALAAWAKEHGVTLLHRTQDVAIPKEFSGIWQTPLEIARVVKALAPAVLETNPRPHAGLGEAMYAPSTSPLRRYPDMINETQIISLLRDGKPRWSKEELDTLLPLLNAHLDAAGQVQRFRPRYWKLLYFKQQGDRWWPAVITDENDAFVTVNMPKEQMIVRARRQFFGERTHPGQELEIRLGKVHPLQNDFQLLETREI